MRPSRPAAPVDRTGIASLLLRVAGVVLLFTALGLALSRAPDRPVESLVARWAPAPSNFIDVKGQLVHLRDEGPRHTGEGSPPPLVLIHGTSASLHTWEGWARALKAQRRVISFDLPGYGLTGPFTGPYADAEAGPDPARLYHGENYATFLVDLLDALQVRQAVLAGNSLGGEIAWRTALRAPQRVAGLVLVDALGPEFRPQALPLGFVIASVPVLNRISEWALPRALVAQGVTSVYGDPDRVRPELVDRYFELALREGNRRALAQRMEHMVVGDGFERVKDITAPTLILWGTKDRLIPPEVGRQFQAAIPGSRLVLLEGLGHVPQEEDPVRSLGPVKAFLGLP